MNFARLLNQFAETPLSLGEGLGVRLPRLRTPDNVP